MRTLDPKRLDSLIRDLGLSFRENSKSFIFMCPFCHKKDILYMFKSSGYFSCYKCRETRGFKGAPEYALKELSPLSIFEIRKRLYNIISVESFEGGAYIEPPFDSFFDDDEDVPIEIESDPIEEFDIFHWKYHHYDLDHQHSKKGVDYLESRGVPKDIAKLYGVRYSPVERAVCFPVIVAGKMVGWQARSIDKEYVVNDEGFVFKRLKIVSTANIPRAKAFMFQPRLEGSPHAFLGEGPFDAIKAHLVGGNIASMGKAVSEGQVSALLRSGIKRLYLGLDPDALAEVEPLLAKIGSDVDVYFCSPTAEDFGAMKMEEVPEVVFNSPLMKPGRIYGKFV